MLIINNQKSEIEEIEVDWAEYTSTQRNIFKEDVIFFMITGKNDKEEVVRLDIETTFSDDKVNNLELNREIDFSGYISDVIYIINGIAYLDLSDEVETEIKVSLTKLDKDLYNLKVYSKKINFDLDGNFSL